MPFRAHSDRYGCCGAVHPCSVCTVLRRHKVERSLNRAADRTYRRALPRVCHDHAIKHWCIIARTQTLLAHFSAAIQCAARERCLGRCLLSLLLPVRCLFGFCFWIVVCARDRIQSIQLSTAASLPVGSAVPGAGHSLRHTRLSGGIHCMYLRRGTKHQPSKRVQVQRTIRDRDRQTRGHSIQSIIQYSCTARPLRVPCTVELDVHGRGVVVPSDIRNSYILDSNGRFRPNHRALRTAAPLCICVVRDAVRRGAAVSSAHARGIMLCYVVVYVCI